MVSGKKSGPALKQGSQKVEIIDLSGYNLTSQERNALMRRAMRFHEVKQAKFENEVLFVHLSLGLLPAETVDTVVAKVVRKIRLQVEKTRIVADKTPDKRQRIASTRPQRPKARASVR